MALLVQVCRPTTRCPYESHQTCRPIGAHANNCSLPRTCQAEGVTPRLVSKAEAKLDQAVKRQATMGSRGMAGRMAGFVSSAVRTSGTTLVRVSGSHRDTFSGDADTQLRGWLKKNRSGKAFEHGSIRLWFHQVGFQLRTYHEENEKGEGSILDLRNVLTFRRSKDPMVSAGRIACRARVPPLRPEAPVARAWAPASIASYHCQHAVA